MSRLENWRPITGNKQIKLAGTKKRGRRVRRRGCAHAGGMAARREPVVPRRYLAYQKWRQAPLLCGNRLDQRWRFLACACHFNRA